MHFYHCYRCKTTMPETHTETDVEYVTSEAWGTRLTQAMRYVVCGTCGSDVEEVPDPSKENDDE